MTAVDGPRVELLAGDRAIADTTASVPHPYPEGGGTAWIATHGDRWRAGRETVFGLVLTSAEELIGAIGLVIFGSNAAAELGYWLGKPFWNQGYMTEAALAIVDFGFTFVGLNRIAATHLTRNPASGRVMEKVGLTFEGIEREAMLKWGIHEDLARRAILHSEWEATRR